MRRQKYDCKRCPNKKNCHDILAPLAWEVKLMMWNRVLEAALKDYRDTRRFGMKTIEELYGGPEQ